MTYPFQHIRQSLASKLSVGILLLVIAGFMGTLGFLFLRSRQIVKQEAIEHAERILDNTSLRVTKYLQEVEVATNTMEGLILRHLTPDSLLEYTHRIVAINPHFNGCSITMEPEFFPQYGRYFSAYSVRNGDSITTEREGEYEYFEKVWYATPKKKGEACWVDPYDDYNEGTLSADQIIVSYCKPLYTAEHHFVGVIATDLSLPWLSHMISAEKPYENSYCVMLGEDGRYFVHPDSTKLLSKTIYSDTDPTKNTDIITLGHEMTSGKKGILEVNINDQKCYVFYRPLPQTQWSIAIVCPEHDIFHSYYRFIYIVIPLAIIGLLLILLYSRKTVAYFIAPLNQLSRQARHITNGHFDEEVHVIKQKDVIGRLQTNFVAMQQSLNEHVNNLQEVNAETEQRNEELIHAHQLAEEASRQKTAFIQDMLHQIRTPLNIIMGFAQVIRDDYENIPQEEITSITTTMKQNADHITRMVAMLVDSSSIDSEQHIAMDDVLKCNDFTREAIAICDTRMVDIPCMITLETEVPDTLTIHTNQKLLSNVMNELLYNAKKFTAKQAEEGKVLVRIQRDDSHVRWLIEDNGPGIAADNQEKIFTPFSKLDDFNEGLGLGLPLSRQTARLLGGELTLDTTFTTGSRFILEIPLTDF